VDAPCGKRSSYIFVEYEKEDAQRATGKTAKVLLIAKSFMDDWF